MSIDYYISSTKMTVCVTVDNNIITESAPIVRKFIGQPLSNLTKWLKKFGSIEIIEL